MPIKIGFSVHDLGVIEALKMQSREMEDYQVNKGKAPDFDTNSSAYAFMMTGIETYLNKRGFNLKMNVALKI